MGIRNLISQLMDKVPEGHKGFHGVYHSGHVDCHYIPLGSEKIFDGRFAFRRDLGAGVVERAEGWFERNRKTGHWRMERRGVSSVKQLVADFSRGRMDGTVELSLEERAISGVSRTVFMLTARQGRIVGELVGTVNGGDFRGQTDDEGLAHGEWTLTFADDEGRTDVVQRETWEHGRLLSAQEEQVQRKRVADKQVRLRECANFFIDSVVRDLLPMVPRGNSQESLHVGRSTK